MRTENEMIASRDLIRAGLVELVAVCHDASKSRGWWLDPITGLSLIPGESGTTKPNEDEIIEAWFPYVIGTKIALIHSEVSEALEAYRTDAFDDKLKNIKGVCAESADVLIRVADLMGCLQAYEMAKERMAGGSVEGETSAYTEYNLAAATVLKLSFNVGRPDHALEARRKPGGKRF